MPHNKLVTQLNDSPASKLAVAAAAAAAGGDSWQHGPQPARENDRERFELLGIITSL